METKYFTYEIDSSRGTIYRTFEGQPGPKGDKGDSATVSVGTVTTGQPGTNVIITNSGTSSDAVFNFTIPRGERGEQGIQGEQGPQGIQGIQGVQGPAGADGQAATIAVGTVTSGSVPSVTNSGTSSAAVFDFVLVPGQDGTNGQDGTAATISVGTVTTGNPGTSATVTNSGTSSAAVFDFVIPQGATGQTGATGPGVPQGGTAGQILSKIDGTDYNTQWIDAPSGDLGEPDLTLYLYKPNKMGNFNMNPKLTRSCSYVDWGDDSPIEVGTVNLTHNYGTWYSAVELKGRTSLAVKLYGIDYRTDTSLPIFTKGDNYDYFSNTIRKVVIGSGLKEIPYCCFQNYTGLINVEFNGSVGLSGNAFKGCTQLQRIVLPAGSYFIEKNQPIFEGHVFEDCTALQYVDLSGLWPISNFTIGVRSFRGESNFQGCTSLKEVVFGYLAPAGLGGVRDIPANTFKNCTSLKLVKMYSGSTPTSVGDGVLLANTNAFDNCPATMTIGVPWSADHSILQAYQTATNWSTYASQMYEMGSVPTTT